MKPIMRLRLTKPARRLHPTKPERRPQPTKPVRRLQPTTLEAGGTRGWLHGAARDDRLLATSQALTSKVLRDRKSVFSGRFLCFAGRALAQGFRFLQSIPNALDDDGIDLVPVPGMRVSVAFDNGQW